MNITLIIIIVIALLVVREILAAIFDWGSDSPRMPDELLSDIKHNRALNREWIKNGKPIVSTTIGWRRDPINRNDGFRDNGYNKNYGGDGHSYSKLIRGGTKEFREQFDKDVKS